MVESFWMGLLNEKLGKNDLALMYGIARVMRERKDTQVSLTNTELSDLSGLNRATVAKVIRKLNGKKIAAQACEEYNAGKRFSFIEEKPRCLN